MKKLIILIFGLIPFFAYTQEAPVLETKITQKFSFTDKQLKQQKELKKLIDKYYNGEYNNAVKISDSITTRIKQLKESIDYIDDERLYIWNTQPIGCSWYCGANYYTEVSSYLPNNGQNIYDKSSIFDDDVRTAWVEGIDGYGIGEHIEFLFPKDAPQITDCYIVNGYNKNEKTWKNNSRVKALDVYVEDKLIATVNLKDSRDEQHFTFPDTIPYYKTVTKRIIDGRTIEGSTIKFVITDIYKGDIYDDTAISELYFAGIGVHCLAEGTIIKMGNNSEIAIENIKAGDRVAIWNPIKNSHSDSRVKSVHKAIHSTMYRITTDLTGSTIIVTDDHPFWSNNGWLSINPSKTKKYTRYHSIAVKSLTIGSEIQTSDGNASISKIEKIEYSKPSYTLELEDNFPFSANGFFVGQE